MELIEFQLAELDRVQPRPGEDEELRALRTLLSSAERVRRLADESYELLYDRDDAVLAGLGQVWKRVGELAALDGRFAPFLDVAGLRSSRSSRTSSSFLRGYAASIDASPERLQEVEDRLAALERLIRKHGPTLADVIEKRRALRAEQATLESLGDRLASAEADVGAATAAYLAKARELSALRQRPRPGSPAPSSASSKNSRWSTRASRCASSRTRSPRPVDRSRHRRRGVLRVSEPRRGSPPARARRLGRRDVSYHAGNKELSVS